VLCAAPKYLRHAPPILSPQDIAQHRVSVYTASSKGAVWSMSDAQGKLHSISVASLPGVRANSGDTCVAAAAAGYGLCFQPMFLLEAALQSAQLEPLLSQYQGPPLGIYALYPSRKHLSGKVRAMVDFLVNAFADKRWDRTHGANAAVEH
jgi:DNA-binding transcriptional LysR family regulator